MFDDFGCDNLEDNFYKEVENVISCTMEASPSKQQMRRIFALIDTILDNHTNILVDYYYKSHHKRHEITNDSKIQPAINIILPYYNQANQFYYPSQYFYPVQPQYLNYQPPTTSIQPQFPNPLSSIQFPTQPYSLLSPQLQEHPKKKDKSNKPHKKSHKSTKKSKKDKKSKKRKDDKPKVTPQNDSKSIECPNGVFSYLFTKFNGNPAEKGQIQIVGNSLGSGYNRCLPKIIDDTWRDNFWCSSGTGERYVQITFKDFLVKIKKYRLRVGFPSGNDYFSSWTLSAVTEKGENVVLHKVVNSEAIKVNRHEATFSIELNEFYVKSIKLKMDGNGHLDNAMRLRNIELYGFIKNL